MSNAKTQERVGKGANPPQSKGSSPSSGDDLNLAEEQIDRVIDGRYRIIELVGQGGMGSVYKAEHLGIRRTVALKLLHPSLALVPEVSRRFEREAFAIGRIEHPNCVNVSDFGQLDDGSLYLVMEYLEGRSLGDVLAEEFRIDPVRTMRILRHVLRGLGHAHKNGIVHRDVKPENVLLVPQEEDPDFAKILDFGIAKLLGEAAADDGGVKLTQAGVAFGTPIYMSPEQAVGNPIDGRADLYAASVMAYEMIAGRPPFYSEDKLDVMSMHTSRPVPSIREMAPDVAIPPEIEQIILRGLAKRPDDRFPGAREYIAALDAILGDPSLPTDTMLHAYGGQALATGAVPLTTGAIPLVTATPPHVTAPVAYHNAFITLPPTHTTGPQAQAQDEHRMTQRRLYLVLALVGCIAVIGVVLAVASSSADPEEDLAAIGSTDTSGKATADARPLSLAAQAAEMLKRGDPKAAIELLTKGDGKKEISQDAEAQLQLGHAHASLGNYKEALAAYYRALELNPLLGETSELQAHLSVMLTDRKDEVALDAVIMLLEHEINLKEAQDKLIALASSSKDKKIRQEAVELVEARQLSDRVDWLQSLSLDLTQSTTCEQRLQVVPKLRALGDKRAIPVLQEVADRTTGRGRRKRYVNKCLRDDALQAVRYLQSLEDSQSDQGATP